MLEAMRDLGSIAASGKGADFVTALTQPLAVEKEGKKQYVMILDLDLSAGRVSLVPEEISDSTADKYLWVGNADGSSSPQWYPTTDNLNFLVSQTVPNLLRKFDATGTLIERVAQELLHRFFYDLGPQSGAQNRYRWVLHLGKVLDPSLLCSKDKGYQEWQQAGGDPDRFMALLYRSVDKNAKKMVDKVKTILEAVVERATGISAKKEIRLWVLAVNGTPLASYEDYAPVVAQDKVEAFYQDQSESRDDLLCSACGRRARVTANTTRLKFKYYITDKVGFSSDLSGKFFRNFTLCAQCYKALLAAESYTAKKLGTRLAGFNVFLIPGFLFGAEILPQQLDQWAEYIKFSFNSAAAFKGMVDYEEKLKDYIEYEDQKNSYLLNILFYLRAQAEFRVLRLIKDVPPSRLDLLRITTAQVREAAQSFFKDSSQWNIDLQSIYFLIPLEVGNKSQEYKKLLDIYDSILSNRPLSYANLIDQFLGTARVYRFEKFNNYNIKLGRGDWETGLAFAVVRQNLFLNYLRRLNLIQGGKLMDYDALKVEGEMRNYLKEMGYGEQEAALFLLGYLVGQIGSAQRRQGVSKAILNKLNYQGMDRNQLVRLTNEVFDKLRQYKILPYNEIVLGEAKRLLDKNYHAWKLSDQENVFFLLSGYSYATVKGIEAAQEKKAAGGEDYEEGTEAAEGL
ncbi:MAG: TIGR02556 family CRISPR-associated protein [Clostridia bacterium]|nr:TIGR02556 family CRISPR-associated protein [Clostridia bacterium]